MPVMAGRVTRSCSTEPDFAAGERGTPSYAVYSARFNGAAGNGRFWSTIATLVTRFNGAPSSRSARNWTPPRPEPSA